MTEVTRPLVLVVEPDSDCREILSELIAHAGYRVVQVSGGAAGLASVRRLKPDVIVGEHPLWLDDATTLCGALHADPATTGIPIVAVTSGALPDELRDARLSHEHVIAKPPDFHEVVRVVHGLAERNRLGA